MSSFVVVAAGFNVDDDDDDVKIDDFCFIQSCCRVGARPLHSCPHISACTVRACSKVAFLVGPEGGWAKGELDEAFGGGAAGGATGSAAPAADPQPPKPPPPPGPTKRAPAEAAAMPAMWRVSLGRRILRAETASMCALAAWSALCEAEP